MSQKTWAATAVAFVLGALSFGCQSGGIGDPCLPEDEYQAAFSGYAVTEVNLESRSFQCETRLCLVNHFQGRVSCPYGQDKQADGSSTLPNTAVILSATQQCRIPGTQEPITVSVNAQVTRRRPIDTVYCSCRCAGSDAQARYCSCPSGFECVDLLSPIDRLGSRELAGSYCIKQGTRYDKTTALGAACNATDLTKDPPGTCGPFNGVE